MLNNSLLLEPPKDKQEVEEIKKLNKAIKSKIAKIITPEGEEYSIPVSLLTLIKTIIDTLDHGNALTLIPMHEQLTTQQAADLLNVSRPFLIKLLERNEIPYDKIGTHRRIRMSDLMKYKQFRDQKRRQHLKNLTEFSQELGLYD